MKPTTARKILIKVKKDYDELADEFDVTRVNSWPEFDVLEKYIKNKYHILDIGCGNGRLIESLKDKNIFYNGIDISPNLVRKALQRYPGEFFKVGDILKIPFQKKVFDAVTAIAVLNHVPSEKLRLTALKEVRRVLKTNGHLLMTNWNLYQSKYRWLICKHQLQNLIGIEDLDKGDAFIPWNNPNGQLLQKRYYHSFTLKELKSLAQQSGFKIIKQYYSLKGEKTSQLKAYNILSVWQKT